MPKPTPTMPEREMVFYEDLADLINEPLPEAVEGEEDELDAEEGGEDENAEEDTEDEDTDDDAESEDSDDDKKSDDESEEEDNDDYITKSEEEPPLNQPVVTQTDDASKFILEGLSKIAVRVIVAGADGKDLIETIEVYGYGDLPQNFKGYATPLEGERFRGAVVNQELKARELKGQFDAKQSERISEDFIKRENSAIAEDLTELRTEGLFPKFKGTPGTKEFNDSEGAKEFDKTLKFMNDKNEAYAKRAATGRAYRHIGFREAYEMQHGQNPKAAEQAEDKARRTAASKIVSKRGAQVSSVRKPTRAVANLMDLADEFVPTGK